MDDEHSAAFFESSLRPDEPADRRGIDVIGPIQIEHHFVGKPSDAEQLFDDSYELKIFDRIRAAQIKDLVAKRMIQRSDKTGDDIVDIGPVALHVAGVE